MLRLGFLFGAGAEVSYGLPSGGKFALEIFRHDTGRSKEEFKKMRESIDKTRKYASKWLPDDYMSKSISSFGKSVYESIIRGTIEHNRDQIVSKLNGFDSFAKMAKTKVKRQSGKDIDQVIQDTLHRNVDEINMNQVVSFTEAFNDGNQLFSNNYFSALLQLYKQKGFFTSDGARDELGHIIVSIMQLHIGALSEKLTRKINDSIFTRKDDDIDLFDDLGEIIQLNYQATGLSGIEYLVGKSEPDASTNAGAILLFAQCIIEDIYTSVLDYKSLIDSNWHYLYYPKSEWSKFCKICIFLLTVRDYILKESVSIEPSSEDGYYHDLAKSGSITPSIVATTNYSNIIKSVLGTNVIYLNGSTDLWYDPYLNRIDSKANLDANDPHFLVPLLFTQSGTKPMTSIDMSEQYVNAYRAWKDSDAIVTVGFGFNNDDEHINGILRTLVDKDGKSLIVVTLRGNLSDEQMLQEVADKLKVSSASNIAVIQVDENRFCQKKQWVNCLPDHIIPLTKQ